MSRPAAKVAGNIALRKTRRRKKKNRIAPGEKDCDSAFFG